MSGLARRFEQDLAVVVKLATQHDNRCAIGVGRALVELEAGVRCIQVPQKLHLRPRVASQHPLVAYLTNC